MARIPESEIERLKLTVSVVRLVEAAGVTLKAHGKDRIGRCPFHDDKTPSLVVSPKSNLWHCLGACQAGGSAIDWVMRWHGVSFRHAVELLMKDEPVAASDQRGPAVVRREAQVLALPPDIDQAAADAALLRQVLDFYQVTLKQSPDALAYLESRGLTHAELIDTFQLGFANRTLGYRLPEKNRLQGAALRSALQRIGIYRDSGHEHFNGSLVVPVFDASGNVVEVYGRKITPDYRLRPGTPVHTYLPGPHRGVFNLDGWRGAEEVILCEALLDALTFWCAGFKRVTSSYGINGFTDEILAALKTSGVRRVLIAYDRDEAGNSAAEKLAPILEQHGLAPYRVLFPKGMDANEYALKVGPAEKSLGLVLRKAQFIGKGVAPSVVAVVPAAASTPIAPASTSSSLAAKEKISTATEPASPTPKPALDIAAEVREREVLIAFGDRRYRVRGLDKNLAFDVLKVNVLVAGAAGELHVDTLDLYQAKARQAFAKQAAVELGVEDSVIQRDLGQVLLKLEALQEQQIAEATKPATPAIAPLDEAALNSALEWLRAPDLIERIVADFERIGLVGEPTNALVGYLAAVSRKLTAPLAIIIQSTSAAGKSALMDAVLRLVPDEDRVHYSAMTGQSLFYLGEQSIKHKILAIAEEEGVRQAAYALKILQSQGELTIASTGKDPQTGKLVTEEYRVEGPVMLFLTTTAIDIDEELLNRCLVLTINESREQTRAIQQRQRRQRTLAGLRDENQGRAIVALHRAAQRLLRPLAVVNPYAEQLTFLDERTRTRRDHQKYLTLIDAIAFLHQHQRPILSDVLDGQVTEYVEVTREDIALANRLAHDVLGRSLDELPPQTRRLLGAVIELVGERTHTQALARVDVRLTRKEIRDVSGLSDTRLRLHLERLVEMEYLLAHSGRQGRRFVYELVFDGCVDEASVRLAGLIDVEALSAAATTSSSPGSDGHFASRSPAVRLSIAAASPGVTKGRKANAGAIPSQSLTPDAENALAGEVPTASHRNGSDVLPLAAALPNLPLQPAARTARA